MGETNKTTVSNVLKDLLMVTELTKPMEISVDLILEMVKNYCNISVIPDTLNFTCALMARDFYGTGETCLIKNADLSSTDIKDFSIGDMRISFNDKNIEKTLDNSTLNKIIENYSLFLQKYRKLEGR